MKPSSNYFLTFLAVILFCSFGYGQDSAISEDAYYSASHAAFESTDKIFPRRVITTEKIFAGSHVSEEMIQLYEFLSNDRIRFVETIVYKGKKSVSEMIQVGQRFFCRDDNGRWKSYAEFCGPQRITEAPKAVERSHTLRTDSFEGEPAKLYERKLLSDVTDEKTNKKTRWYSNYQFWIGSDGRILRREEKSGKQGSDALYSSTITTYDYRPTNLKIDAPIK